MILPTAPIRTVLAAPRSRTRNELRAWLRQQTDVRLVGEAPNGQAAVRLIERSVPDLAIVHVDLPRLDGFGVVEALIAANPPPAVVMLGLRTSEAVRAFHVRAADFLQVPFDMPRLRHTLDRVRRLLLIRPGRPAVASDREAKPADRLALRTRRRVFFVLPEELFWARAKRRKTEVCLVDGIRLVDTPFGDLERRLPKRSFARINRSTLVRHDFIREIRPKSHGDSWVLLEDGEPFVLTRGRRRGVLARLLAGDLGFPAK